MINKIKNSRGFTLIETLVAVLLLATAIAGPLSIASKGLTATLVAKDQFVAFYLAQDAVEFIRFARDSNTLSKPKTDWLAGATDLTPCLNTNCRVDSIQSTISSCTNAACNDPSGDVLRYDTGNHYFTYNAAASVTPQHFFRTVSIQYDQANAPDEAIVTVSVTWSDVAGVTHKPITVRENLFNWQ